MEMREEVGNLIAGEKVAGTPVFNPAGERLGEIFDVMIDKVSGDVAFAVMSFGGFLGIGERYHPLPWSTLKYDTEQGGYVVELTKEQLEGGPAYEAGKTPTWTRAYEHGIHEYYKPRADRQA